MHRAVLAPLMDAALGVLEGRPHWRAFQARLLGPAMLSAVEWMARTAFPHETEPYFAMRLFFLLMTLAKNGALFLLTALHSRNLLTASALTLAGSMLFLLFSDGWLYTWDFFDVIIFSALAFLMMRWSGSGVGFYLLFLLALPNRESAAFFGFWLICLGAARSYRGRAIHWKEPLLGLAVVLIAAAYTTAAREWLLVAETGTGASGIPTFAGNHLQIVPNAVTFAENFVSPKLYINAWILLMLAHGITAAKAGLKQGEPRRLALGLFLLGLLGAIFSFGLINEARVFLIYVPFLVFSLAEYGVEQLSNQSRLARSASQLASPEP